MPNYNKKAAHPWRGGGLCSKTVCDNSGKGENNTKCDDLEIDIQVQSQAATHESQLCPSDCVYFEGCNAPNCPFDLKSMTAPYYPGERICPYLWAFVKPGIRGKLKYALGVLRYQALVRAYLCVKTCQSILLSRLKAGKHKPLKPGFPKA